MKNQIPENKGAFDVFGLTTPKGQKGRGRPKKAQPQVVKRIVSTAPAKAPDVVAGRIHHNITKAEREFLEWWYSAHNDFWWE